MEAKIFQSIQPYKWGDTANMMKKPSSIFPVSHRFKDNLRTQMFMNVQSNKKTSVHYKPVLLKVSSCLKNSTVQPFKLSFPDNVERFKSSWESSEYSSVLKSGGIPAAFDESLGLKKKSAEVEQLLDGRCIYLVGMMGSGKTTIGRVLSDVLTYSFADSDLLVEQTMGAMSVADIFKQHGEGFFREKETEALKELSMMHRLVISTGGGAVIRPINWKHMRSGISVWLDVPLECLARRISSVGTSSRPLLHGESGDAYSKALTRLSTLLEERGEAYANSSIRVSLEHIASKLGNVRVDNLSPASIAIEVLEQIESFLKE